MLGVGNFPREPCLDTAPEMRPTSHLLDGLTVHVVGDLQIRQPLLGHDGVPVAPEGSQDEATSPAHQQLTAAPAHCVGN